MVDPAIHPCAANDADWIVGYGLDSAQNYRAFVLRPNE